MPLSEPIITIAFSRTELAQRRAEILPDLVAAVIDRQRAHGDPEVVCEAYEPSLTAAPSAPGTSISPARKRSTPTRRNVVPRDDRRRRHRTEKPDRPTLHPALREFIRRGQRAQAAVDAIVATERDDRLHQEAAEGKAMTTLQLRSCP